MAVMQISYKSRALMRNVTFCAAIPTTMQSFPVYPPKEKLGPLKSIYLLHGVFGDFSDWLLNTKILSLAEEYGIAVFMPSGENSVYLDDPLRGNNFAEYVGQELVQVTRELFHLSDRREDTCIAGLSAGGYGALRNGLKYCDTFGYVAGFSSYIICYDLEYTRENAPTYFSRRDYFAAILGDFDKLRETDKDLEGLVLQNKAAGKEFPKLYLCCGTDDLLLGKNQRYHAFLQEQSIDHIYEEGPGGHEWRYWETHIENVMKWMKKGENI